MVRSRQRGGASRRSALTEPSIMAVLAFVAMMSTPGRQGEIKSGASAFMTPMSLVGTVTASSRRSQVYSDTLSTALYSSTEAEVTSSSQKLTMELVDDQNRNELLNPSTTHPVLVDAFAPFCGPCKLLDKVLKKVQPRYEGKVDFCRWNVSDKEGTAELKAFFLEQGHTLTKLPSLIVFREGKPVAVRPGFANEFQLDDFLERTLPDVLERTFDENGVKIIPLPEEISNDEVTDSNSNMASDIVKVTPSRNEIDTKNIADVIAAELNKEENETRIDCFSEEECWERVEKTIWQNRTVVPAFDGILMPRP